MSSTPVHADNVFETVASEQSLTVTSPTDLDLECEIQFTTKGGAAFYDFSAYVLVDDTNTVEDARHLISEEVHAFDRLLEAVQDAHSDFITKAFDAMDALKQGAPPA